MNTRENRLYRIWRHIKSRCENPNVPVYPRYGGRGIKCLWKNFKEFERDVNKSYQDNVKKFGERNTTIDRINNDGDYSKENCRWANYTEQNRNRRCSKFITFNNQTKTLFEWSEIYGIKYRVVYERLRYQKWSIEDALTKPLMKNQSVFK